MENAREAPRCPSGVSNEIPSRKTPDLAGRRNCLRLVMIACLGGFTMGCGGQEVEQQDRAMRPTELPELPPAPPIEFPSSDVSQDLPELSEEERETRLLNLEERMFHLKNSLSRMDAAIDIKSEESLDSGFSFTFIPENGQRSLEERTTNAEIAVRSLWIELNGIEVRAALLKSPLIRPVFAELALLEDRRGWRLETRLQSIEEGVRMLEEKIPGAENDLREALRERERCREAENLLCS